jgi:hypothetical protein
MKKETMMTKEAVYWLSPLGGYDDFGQPYTLTKGGIMYDAKTSKGPWANMTHESWLNHRATEKLGTGFGQKYERQADGRWLKIEG